MIYGIIVAGGKGSRMNSDTPKQFMEIDGKPMLYYSLKAFEESDCDGVIVVGDPLPIRKIVADYGFKKVINVIPGGAQRYDSCYNGICAVPAHGLDDMVLIHDAARPCVTTALINRMAQSAATHFASVPVVNVKDTIISLEDSDDGYNVVDRDKLRAIQTPQAFNYALIRNAYDALADEHDKRWITDDAMVASRKLHVNIYLEEGEESNIKVTTQEDLSKLNNGGII